MDDDADARLPRKGNGKEAKLSYNGNLLTENRNAADREHGGGFRPNGTGPDAALILLEQLTGTRRGHGGSRQGV
jgi:hypothetical protein